MLIYSGVVVLVLVVIAVYEYRVKQPDQIILFEKGGKVSVRQGKFYPRHFSLAFRDATYSMVPDVEAEAKGKLLVNIKLAVTTGVKHDDIPHLIRVGGWSNDAVKNASKELDLIIRGKIREYTSNYEIEELTAEGIKTGLRKSIEEEASALGLEIISFSVQGADPVDQEIAEAIRQREEARIKESSEKINQQARISAAEIKLKADKKILEYNHELELNKLALKNAEFVKESELANKKLDEQVKRDRTKLALEKEEIKMLSENPELLVLTPQLARLAEASQQMKNAKTVVSLGNEKDSALALLLQNLVAERFNIFSAKKENKDN